MSELEKALHVILDAYHKYTSDSKTLKKGEMKTLLEKEIMCFRAWFSFGSVPLRLWGTVDECKFSICKKI
uniref:S100/CaBP-9k-type calcium binding subdomain domain-containing protein n=1 Tax=Leptobrachium leishanense TaxID=445787 RepID=A0A8C5LVW8_9ANUR